MEKITFLIILLISFGLPPVFAAECELPPTITLSAKEDYAPYNQLVVDCVDWLENTSFKEQKNKRAKVQAFLIKWVTGSPSVHVQVTEYSMDIWSADTEKLMVLFLGGWSRASILADHKITDLDGLTAAVRTVLQAYTLDGAPRKSREIKRLLKAEEKGELTDYLKKKM